MWIRTQHIVLFTLIQLQDITHSSDITNLLNCYVICWRTVHLLDKN